MDYVARPLRYYYYIVCLWKWNNSYAMLKTDAKTNLLSLCVYFVSALWFTVCVNIWICSKQYRDAGNLWACCVLLSQLNAMMMMMFWYFPLNFYEFLAARTCLFIHLHLRAYVEQHHHQNDHSNWSGQIEQRIHTDDKRNQWTHSTCMHVLCNLIWYLTLQIDIWKPEVISIGRAGPGWLTGYPSHGVMRLCFRIEYPSIQYSGSIILKWS